ncbi:disease resistance protein RGA5 isoform X2 [Triticum aestivum]|nr:disease resistance protein RGA5-like isoform X2 [Triticum aestivum]XP_044417641.1 disease resistance protein RGA5-like isoform X2 [Triticum aestivum]XP_044417642.1 disease resistance protein RGA5-like isoform X2 [Triticum aestivum]XP_044417643.1 disease resistance protein RGA5-like isoform X2 [Triticum aestivum]XP_044417645.1 disease resistance protein RGA5-like isoform X2 [Triticum aestivum]XP_044417646.1 disease resistance protein RGA5-like isoform X2 [Triticum aestivum]
MISASTGAMNSLLGKLATLMGEEFAKLKNLRKEVKFIRDELGSMKDTLEVLGDVDKLDPQTKSWRDTLREMSYDIEDIIDDFMHHIGKKSESQEHGFAKKTVRLLKKLRVRHQIAGRIKEIKALVLEISVRRQRYKLDIPQSRTVEIDPRVAVLYENAANLVGVEGPVEELESLLKDENEEFKVVSIVGFGGLGKTTLANVVYGKLKKSFSHCAFVPVSQKPDITKLLHGLMSQLGCTPSSHHYELNVLLDRLREHLQNKRYFVIIDDIWDVSAWKVIKCAFPENDLGSRVIVTTRSLEVATACCSLPHDYVLQMKTLSNEDSRRLFFGRIFGTEDACPNQLRDVSVEILKKCGGLPLAIISIAGLLASEGPNREEWEHVRKSLGSMYGAKLTLDRMREILNLSYKDLPCHLKTCLLYVGMYPEDYTIKRSDLERQWMAEGFVSKENGQDMEKIARNYFNELVNRSLVQPVRFDGSGSVTECKVHDMMLDLILCKCAEENFLTVVDGSQDNTTQKYKVRRLSIRLNGAANATLLQGKISLSQVRSVMIFGWSNIIPPLSNFKFLRVLFVEDYRTIDLTGMSELYQLRYIQIDGTRDYVHIPTQIGGLQQLETFDIRRCASVPSNVVHLPRLLHLRIEHDRGLPDGIGKMKYLRSLDGFNLSVNSLDNFIGLGELTNIRDLTLTGNMVRHTDVLCSSLRKLCSLEFLYICTDGCMDGLSPPCSLQILATSWLPWGCWFSRVPNWMRELHNLRVLRFKVDELLTEDVDIVGGLPSLTDLILYVRRPRKEMIAINGTGAFPVLKRFGLTISSPSCLTFQSGAMPMLQGLYLTFGVKGWKQNGAGPAGIEHLPALEEVSAELLYNGTTESEKCSAESAFRNAVDRHPNNPRIAMKYRCQYLLTGIGL